MRPRLGVSAVALAFVIANIGGSCATYNNARPLEPGQHAVTATFGGPLTQVPNIGAIPLPNVTLEGRHGILHHFDVNYGLHLLPLVYGVAGAHAGATYQLFDQPSDAPLVPALSVGERLFLFTNAIDSRKARTDWFAMSQTDLNASWGFADELVIGWIGGAGYVPLDGAWHVHLAPFGGVELRPLSFLRVGAEVRWLAPAIDQRFAVVDWIAPGDHGGVLVTAGVAVVFGGAP